ncbi:MAG: outer membrane lipoprotein LolB [Gammaproteobacteria bacterium]|nr:outer membrane lipoprotein LolB [Gammaproteobacteria bacterium]
MPRAVIRRLAALRILAGALFPLLVVSCASVPGGAPLSRADAEAAWSARSALLREIREWEVSGRISVSGPDGSWNARIHWSQRGDAYTIDFMSLLGQRLARMEAGDGGAMLRLPDQEPRQAATAGELLEASFGWSAPVDALRFWVLGVPQPHFRAETRLDDRGRLSRLEQEGWSVEYPQYTAVDGGPGDLPRKLMLEGRALRIRMVIDAWELGG